MKLRAVAATILFTSVGHVLPSGALAQDRSGIRLGTVHLSPAIRSATVGYDSNIFYDPVKPRGDFTATFNPDLGFSLTAGRNRLTANTGLTFVYFREFESERSVGTANALRWEFAANRFRPYARFSFTDLTTRPTPEINARVRNQLSGASVGTQITLAPRVSLVFEAQGNRTTYDDEARYLGNDLSQELNQTVNIISASMWYDLTPLTRFMVTSDAQRHRYDTSGPRDAQSYGVVSGFEFAPTALVRGGATFGYRHLDIKDSTVPDHRGLVMSVDLSYVLRGTTKFSIRADRDTAPSLVDLQPYYVRTGTTVSITQRLTGALDAYGLAGRQRQDYQRSQRSATRLFDLQSDTFQYTLQAGMGFRVGRTTRMNVYIDSLRRRGGFQGDSRTTRIMTSFSYDM